MRKTNPSRSKMNIAIRFGIKQVAAPHLVQKAFRSFYPVLFVSFLSSLVICSLLSPLPLRAADKAPFSEKQPLKRLVSLAPSNTELIYSLNAGNELVGVSEICDFPPQAKEKEKVGNFASVKLEKLAKLRPDLVLLISGQEAIAHTLKKHGFKIEVLDNNSIDRIPSNLLRLGVITGHESEAKKLANSFQLKIDGLRNLTATSKSKPRVFICVWPQPLMSAGKGSFMDQSISICGGINCTGDLSQPYPRINPEKLLMMKPDLILVPNEVRNEKFWTRPPWKSLKAVQTNQVYILPQHETDCLYRPTTRILDALYWLALRLHPEQKKELVKWFN